jgi:hypothetical protein
MSDIIVRVDSLSHTTESPNDLLTSYRRDRCGDLLRHSNICREFLLHITHPTLLACAVDTLIPTQPGPQPWGLSALARIDSHTIAAYGRLSF